MTLAARLTGKTAAETISAMLAVFGRINPHLRRSITFDNDTAFAQHGLLRTMRDMTTWFCDAYASWQKGGVENANGRLRRWLPRHLDIDRTSDQDIQEIVLTTNLTPRKCLGFKTPFQALLAELGKDVQIRFGVAVALRAGILGSGSSRARLKSGQTRRRRGSRPALEVAGAASGVMTTGICSCLQSSAAVLTKGLSERECVDRAVGGDLKSIFGGD